MARAAGLPHVASGRRAGTYQSVDGYDLTKKNGPLLAHMTTIDAARDMDSIRAALGQKQITYYGFSYGTYLGQVYSTLFPSHVRRLVMDSNVVPRKVWYAPTSTRTSPSTEHQDLVRLGRQVPQGLSPRHHREGGGEALIPRGGAPAQATRPEV